MELGQHSTRRLRTHALQPVKRGNSGLEEGFVLIGVKAEDEAIVNEEGGQLGVLINRD